MLQLGLIWGRIGGFDLFCSPHCGEFDIRVCQIPTIAPYNLKGGGGGIVTLIGALIPLFQCYN